MVVIQEHEHPLVLIDLNPKYPHEQHVYDDEKDLISNQAFQSTCDRCDKKITYFHRYYYNCDKCDHTVHKLCLELPTIFKHASHLAHTLFLFQNETQGMCHVCKCTIWDKQLCYHCCQCILNLCLDCGTKRIQHHTIYHPSHKHPLVPTSKPILAMCDACGEEHKGVFYQCITCFRSFIHEECAFYLTRLLIQHGTCDKFFHTHPLILTYGFSKVDQQARFYPRCRVCDKSFSGYENLWVYKCESCRYYIHLNCAYLRSEHAQSAVGRITLEKYEDESLICHLPLSKQKYNKVIDFFSKETNHESRITHNSHEHPLILMDDITTVTKKIAICVACLIPIVENMKFYKCGSNGQRCDFLLHEWCTRLPNERHGYRGHQHHNLLCLQWEGRFKCKACTWNHFGFAYSCAKCEYIVDLFCAFIPNKITHKSHPNHLLSRSFEQINKEKYCRICLAGFSLPFETSLSCKKCDFHLHIGCAFLLPETIRHKYDKHPMSLAYSPVENHEGDYFCEVCEEELNPNASFYHCHECVQSIHTACAPLIPQTKAYLYGIHKTEYPRVDFESRTGLEAYY